MIRALTFDYWDTLYEGGALPERVALRRTAVGALLGAYGRALPEEQLRVLYEESGREAERSLHADIAIAQWQYYLASGDVAWLKEDGWSRFSSAPWKNSRRSIA